MTSNLCRISSARIETVLNEKSAEYLSNVEDVDYIESLFFLCAKEISDLRFKYLNLTKKLNDAKPTLEELLNYEQPIKKYDLSEQPISMITFTNQ